MYFSIENCHDGIENKNIYKVLDELIKILLTWSLVNKNLK